LNSPITEIDYSGRGVKLTADGITFEGSYALVTVSVGVLKSKKITFKPELPYAKLEAIDHLQMGNMQKVIVPFKKNIFPEHLANSWILYQGDLPSKEALRFAKENHLPLVHERRAIMALVIEPLNQNIAIGFFGGDWAKTLEEQCAPAQLKQFSGKREPCDNLSIAITKSALSNISGMNATDIDNNLQGEIQVTRWSLDPTSFGAYSAAKPREWYQREILAEPVEDDTGTARLFFAGEGTAEPKYNGSYAGAYLSGKRAAREIDAAVKNDQPHALASEPLRGFDPRGRNFWNFQGLMAFLALTMILVSLVQTRLAPYGLGSAPLASKMLRLATGIGIAGATVSSVILPGNEFELAATVILVALAVWFLADTAKPSPTADHPPTQEPGSD
jgi:hypothetical protein